MRKKERLSKSLLLLAVLLVGAGTAWADTYVKVTKDADLVAGETYIIASSNGVATGYSNKKLTSTSSGYTTLGNSLTMTTTTPMEFTLGTSSTNYTLRMNDGKYLGYSGSSTDFRNSQEKATANNEKWTIAYNSTYSLYTIVNVQTTTRHIGYSGNDKFAPYANMSSYAPATLYKRQPAYTITATANYESMGTVSVASSRITATPNDGYRVSKTTPYEVKSGTATIVQSGNVFAVTASTDCTIQINFEAVPLHTATFYVNGSVVSVVNVSEDADITFPTNPDGLGEYVFRGWATSAIDGMSTEKPTLVSSGKMDTEDLSFYAVFAESTTTMGVKTYTLDYSSESALSSSTGWGSYGVSFTYEASDGGSWVVKAYKNSGMQINKGKNASIKVPDCSGDITTINITTTTTTAKAVGFSKSDYSGSGTPTYEASGTDVSSQTLDLTGKGLTTGYIVPKESNAVITKIVVNYSGYTNYCTTVPVVDLGFSIGTAGWATYVGKATSTFPTGVTGYVVTAAGETSVTLGQVDVIAKDTPVLLSGPAGDYEMGEIEEEYLELNEVDLDDNLLQVVGDAETVTTAYVLAKPASNPVAFYLYTGSGLDAGQVYLPATSGARAMLAFAGDGTTGIETAGSVEPSFGTVYDLQGRHVLRPVKGLYIMGGKKIIVK